jgi:hypothetical protein
MNATATAALIVCGSVMWAAHASSVTSSVGSLPRDFSVVKKIGCERAGDNCPYGYRIERHGGKGWSCTPCWKPGSRYRDWNDYEPRRYRDYGDYGERRYRRYEDERYYEPRRYPREYY